ncbi:MAG: ABC transporter substrate-binding protein [Thermodesulfobacteriota bacterium]|nr:ABC transporter substrate-binding protein [Thermodesulfobacteriota bacterium]
MNKNTLFLFICITMLFLSFPEVISAAPDKKIKIGVIAPMKFTPGKEEWHAATQAAEEINNEGGVLIKGIKYKIELVKADSNETLSVADALSAMERLITVDKVNFITGGYRTEAVLGMQDLAADYEIIYIGGGGAPMLTERVAKNFSKYKYYFRAIHTNIANVTTAGFMVNDMVIGKVREKLGIAKPKVALLVDKVKIGDIMVRMMRSITPKMGAEIIGEWRPSTFTTDLTPELTAIKAAGAQVIYTFGTGPSSVFYSKQWGELKIPAAMVGGNVEAQRKNHWKLTGGKCEYVTICTTFGRAEITPKSIPFWDKHATRFKEYPGFQAGTYDVIYLLKEAVERAGTLETEAMVKAIETTDYLGAQGRMVFYPNNHKWPHGTMWGPKHIPMVGLQWRNGELVAVWPDGMARLGDKRWGGVRFKGTVNYQLPPWVIKYWKGK